MNHPEQPLVQADKPASPLRRPLRWVLFPVLFVVWLVFILSPCFVIVLAVQREIVITYSDVPADELRIWTISEARLRGVAISNTRRVSSVAPVPDADGSTATCTITDTRFLLWQGSADDGHQCSCYVKRGETWQSVAEGAAACTLAGDTR